ncbi:MAG: hypothetical protein R2788_12880 [Saprospiraceae bacterium]
MVELGHDPKHQRPPPGNYSVTVFEGATCQASANFNVGNNTNAPDISTSILDAVCGEPTEAST